MTGVHRNRRRILVSISCLTLTALAACADAPAAPRLAPAAAERDLALPPDIGPAVLLWDDWKSVSAGGDHSCAVTGNGKVYCWGSNAAGQLGSSGADARRPKAINLANTPGGANLRFISVSAGENHTCAVTVSGPVYCWGSNIGATPTALPTAQLFSQVSVGTFDACAVNQIGTIYCWTLGSSPYMVATAPPTIYFASVSVGIDHMCAIGKFTAKAYCWGVNDFGQLGVNSARSKSDPTEVISSTGNNNFAALEWYNVDAGTRFTCGVQHGLSWPFGWLFTGAYCWGTGSRGQIGNTQTFGSIYPKGVWDPPGLSLDVVSAGGQQACGIEIVSNSHGDTWCWGNNASGQLGDPTAGASLSFPTRVAGTRVYKQISAGRDHTCALSQYTRAENVAGAAPKNAVIMCWGLNSRGQLGNMTTTNSNTPVVALHPQQLYILF